MKPPPRARTKRDWSSRTEVPESRRKGGCKWGQAELKKLLDALKAISQTTGGLEEINYVLLKKRIPTRSISEISAMVDSLKKNTISSARFQLRMKNWEEKQFSKSIEEWTHMASALAGTLETILSAAFSQVLIVSSTEPCTLRNCDPYQDPRPTIDHTVPWRLVPRMSLKSEDPSALLLITPAPAISGSRRLPAASKVVRGQTSNIFTLLKQTAVTSTAATSTFQTECPNSSSLSVSPADQTPTPLLLSEKLPASLSSSSPKPLTLSASDFSPVPTAAQSAVASCCLPVSRFSSHHSTVPLSNTAAELHAKSGQTSKHATTDSPRTFGVKFVVDFEKIYKFLSVFQRTGEDYQLTPMESAIVLDLLMSLPEELPYLDCKNLHKHLFQVSP
ncbi:uncharacterized protein FYW61_019534 isoform 2-T2 [Anableps anableps]